MKMDLGLTLAFVISAGYSWLDLPLSATFCHFLRLPRLPGFACDHNGSSFFCGSGARLRFRAPVWIAIHLGKEINK
jgi:hypothetical protein